MQEASDLLHASQRVRDELKEGWQKWILTGNELTNETAAAFFLAISKMEEAIDGRIPTMENDKKKPRSKQRPGKRSDNLVQAVLPKLARTS